MKLRLPILILASVVPAAFAHSSVPIFTVPLVTAVRQSPSEAGAKSDQILDKMRQIDLLNHILPILWTKDQLNQVLPPIEKARQNVKKTQAAEANVLQSYDPKLSSALDKAQLDGLVPGKDLIREIDKVLRAMSETRVIVAKENEDLVYKAVDAALNKGQKKAMANSLEPQAIDPSLDITKMTDEEKIRFYIRDILLHPLAYDLLVKLSRNATTPDK